MLASACSALDSQLCLCLLFMWPPSPPARSYYQQERRRQGSFFRWLRLSSQETRERGGGVARMLLPVGPGALTCPAQLGPVGIMFGAGPSSQPVQRK